MTSTRPRPLPVLAALLVLASLCRAWAPDPSMWTAPEDSLQAARGRVSEQRDALSDKGDRLAGKALTALDAASAALGEERSESAFKRAAQAAKKLEKLAARARKEGAAEAVERIAQACSLVADSYLELLLDLVDSVRVRPGFPEDERVYRAVAKAEGKIDQAQDLLAAGGPACKAVKAMLKGAKALRRV